jgi:hypothetical protein
MTTDEESGVRVRIAQLQEPVISAIADLDTGESLQVNIPAGAGKSYILVSAIDRFLQHHSDTSVLFIDNALSITQKGELLEELGIPAVLVRDQSELKSWLYHSPRTGRQVVLVADKLVGTAMVKILQDTSFKLVIIDSSRRHKDDLRDVLLTLGESLVTVNPVRTSIETEAVAGSGDPYSVSASPISDAARKQISGNPRLETIKYHIPDSERRLISEALHYLSQLQGESRPRARRAATSSRAALSAALLASQYRRVAPGAHRILERPQHVPSIDERLQVRPSKPIEQRAPDNDALLPAWGTPPPAEGDRLDYFLDRLDELEGDAKLSTTLSFVQERLASGVDVIIFAQNAATSEYVRGYLNTEMPEVSVGSLRRSQESEKELPISANAERVFTVVDKDLSYLGWAPPGFVHVWFDPPSTRAHGYQRLDFIAPGGAAVVYALMAEPPFLSEEHELRSFGFVTIET